ncbi:glycosyltransferase family 2 protein [Saccharopolyspora sp. NFXS83]|uniref:glycosyltransferase family 2 protein n=1 Tax=Saccharopolyspora sp. NFXS83 TaxID=2993560 RepID=UPI00224B3637|nr:glycosyltransferase family 2 protein [Saccharopolyspora sp. NFXS83]MCX2733889.1 glycosyltransferase family 2 protein [Saccharopolyspora sp. NFXS83]
MRGGVRSTVVVVTWRGRAHLSACLDAVAALDRPHRTVVVDNASDDGSAELLARHPSEPEVLRLPRNLGYAGGIAAALHRAETPFVAWLNDDAAPEPGWLAALEDALDADRGAWAAASAMRTPDGELQSAGVRLTSDGHGADITDRPAGGAGAAEEVFGFCGGAALLRTAELRAAGGVPERFFCYYEDTDTAWRLRLGGGRVVFVPGAGVVHLHGASTRPGSPRFHRWNERNRLLMLLRCAPARIAAAELVRFAALTSVLPLRRLRGAPVPPVNFRLVLRLRVLAEVVAMAPAALRARRSPTALGRTALWTRWSGR